MSRKKKGEPLPAQRHYFVDEAGDSVLFGKRGKVMIGQEGCSRFFMMGCLEVADPVALTAEMETLRAEMLADPTINRVPSMTPERKKTALVFHAKDDIPEVRRDVFKLLMRHEVKFYAVIRDKTALATAVRLRNETDPTYRYNENEVYDALVSRLFRDRLHKADHHEVVFASRGNKDRTHALSAALDKARVNFFRKWAVMGTGTIAVQAAQPQQHGGLQAVDYFLWALQRFYERCEDRFLSLIWPKTRLVMDIDDVRAKGYGEGYTQAKPLTAEALREKPGDIGISGRTTEHTAWSRVSSPGTDKDGSHDS
ncbi:MAG: DUF3800 domain-containing protein [Alphaproteobacteria bacterium]|nr:DUF3800 domain-containing protein [Alphaproteobacteria bacterium]